MCVTVEAVSKAYRGRQGTTQALAGVSLALAEGEFLAIVGRSGCGKTTLLKAIAGLEGVDEGRIWRRDGLDGRGAMSMVFQTPALVPWRDVLRNVYLPSEVMGLPEVRSRAPSLLAAVGLEGFERSLPHQLSGGMQQRVALCRALITEPALLLMDEPFGALDALTREQMNVLLQRVWLEHRSTVVLVTHNIEEAVFLADRIVVMSPRPGRIVDVVTNEMPRPRGLESLQSPLFAELTGQIRKAILGQEHDAEWIS